MYLFVRVIHLSIQQFPLFSPTVPLLFYETHSPLIDLCCNFSPPTHPVTCSTFVHSSFSIPPVAKACLLFVCVYVCLPACLLTCVHSLALPVFVVSAVLATLLHLFIHASTLSLSPSSLSYLSITHVPAYHLPFSISPFIPPSLPPPHFPKPPYSQHLYQPTCSIHLCFSLSPFYT